MKILCTGSRGFIGQYLVQALRKEGHTVHYYDITDGQDIANKTQLGQHIGWADVVYHLAALTNVQESFLKPYEYYKTNVLGTVNVSRACKHRNIKLIYTSTAAIYDPYSSPYAHSKKIAEDCITYLHSNYVIFRLFNVYGKGMNRNTMLARFKRENPITIYGDGKQTRDFIYVDDVVRVLVAALSPKFYGFCGDLGTGKAQTVNSIAKQFKKKIIYKPARKEIRHSVANMKVKFIPTIDLKSHIDKYRQL